MVGAHEVPIGANGVGFLISLGLAVWMFKVQKG